MGYTIEIHRKIIDYIIIIYIVIITFHIEDTIIWRHVKKKLLCIILNSLRPIDAIWRHVSFSILIHLMACRQMDVIY